MPEIAKEKTGTPSWGRSIASAVLAVAALLTAAVLFNLAIGRMIHWDIVTILAVFGFLGLTMAFRYAH